MARMEGIILSAKEVFLIFYTFFQKRFYTCMNITVDFFLYLTVKPTTHDSIKEYIIWKLNLLVVVDFRFISASLHV